MAVDDLDLPKSMSDALIEFYASGGEDGIAVLSVEIEHPSPDFETIRWVTNVEPGDGDEAGVIYLPLVQNGEKVPFQVCAFRLVRPGADKDGPTDAKLQLDGVSGALQAPLKAAQGFGVAMTVVFRVYLIATFGELVAITGPDEVLEGLELSNVSVTADMAEATLSFSDGRGLAVPTGPDAFFDRGNYPALFT